jgi:hypothetical protein
VPGCHGCHGARVAKVPRVPKVPGCQRCQGCQGAKGARGARVPWVPWCQGAMVAKVPRVPGVPGCHGCQGTWCEGAMGASVPWIGGSFRVRLANVRGGQSRCVACSRLSGLTSLRRRVHHRIGESAHVLRSARPGQVFESPDHFTASRYPLPEVGLGSGVMLARASVDPIANEAGKDHEGGASRLELPGPLHGDPRHHPQRLF